MSSAGKPPLVQVYREFQHPNAQAEYSEIEKDLPAPPLTSISLCMRRQRASVRLQSGLDYQ
jgi:hypothetical protein